MEEEIPRGGDSCCGTARKSLYCTYRQGRKLSILISVILSTRRKVGTSTDLIALKVWSTMRGWPLSRAAGPRKRCSFRVHPVF